MRRWVVILMLLCTVSASAQYKVRIVTEEGCEYESSQLQHFLEMGGGILSDSKRSHIFVGTTSYVRQHYSAEMDSLRDGGYLICGDGKDLCLYGKGEKGTLYAVYSFLEMLGYCLYTPDAMVVPDVSHLTLPKCHVVSNPAFEYREVLYYYPNHSQLYADWHHLHTQADRERMYGMYVHTFSKLLKPSVYFEKHPEWYSLNGGRRMSDGQLCLSNREVLDELCVRLADTMAALPQKKIWSVSPNDNYNACECRNCRHLDSVYGGPSGTLLWFVNQVARRFPDKTISTLAYQYTRKAPTSGIKPEPNVQIMLCPIESGRQAPITKSDPAFKKDMEDWSRLTDNIYLWDYVAQFRNFWNPFPNLHVLQPNLKFFKENGARMMFEQATGADNITSWMDIRCYMIAKLLWNPDANMDSIMADFYNGYYGDAGRYVEEIIDTMTAALVRSEQTLNIYGYAVDGCFYDPDSPAAGYLYPTNLEHYYDLMRQAKASTQDSAIQERLRYFRLALDFAHLELCYGDPSEEGIIAEIDRLEQGLLHFGVPQMMEMGCSPQEYAADMRHWAKKLFGENLAYGHSVSLRRPATAPYNNGTLTDGDIGIMDYRHSWLGFWGDTLDAVIDLGEPRPISYFSIDFFYYPLSWIFQPQYIIVYRSVDGERWEHWGRLTTENPEVLATPDIHTYRLERGCLPLGEPAKYRYVRVVAPPLPEIPSWHRAAGQKPWIFTDEIIVK